MVKIGVKDKGSRDAFGKPPSHKGGLAFGEKLALKFNCMSAGIGINGSDGIRDYPTSRCRDGLAWAKA